MTPENDETKNEVLLDLNFVPTWARKPPEASPYGGDFARPEGEGGRHSRRSDDRWDGREKERFDRRRRDGGGGRGPGREERGGPPRGPQPERFAGAPPAGDREPAWAGDRERGGPPRGARPEALPPLIPVEVSFIPDRSGLITIARRIAKMSRAFSLFDVASLFLSQPDYFTLKLAAADPAAGGGSETEPDPLALCQCRECKQIFADLAQGTAHVMARHLETFYRREEQTVEPPQGAFVCVARCGYSGELLGPPNYHSYNDRVMELHRTRFSHLSLDDYRRRIENVHDQALLDQWKEQMKKRTVYRVVAAPEQPPLESFTEVENHFLAHYAAEVVKPGATFTLPGAVSRELEDRRLRRAVMEAWHRENRFPLRLSITLRLAFRHLGLHTFKTATGGNFVTAIVPQALDPETAIPLIKEVLQALEANPGQDRGRLLEVLRPGEAPDSPAAHDLLAQLRWLVDKGHVIEFSDGRLAVPRSAVRKIQQAKREERKHGRPPGRPEEEQAG